MSSTPEVKSPVPFCRAPFVNVRFRKDHYSPCCLYEGVSKKSTLSEYLASQELADIRKAYTDGNEFLPGCSTCQRMEQAGQTSYRHHLNDRFKHHALDKIVFYDIFPGNVCNLSCFMCRHDNSSALGAEHKRIGWIKDYKVSDTGDLALEDMANMPDLESVSLIGGEFFLTKRNAEILQVCLDRKLSVRVVTNGTIVNDKLLDLLKQIDDLELQISVDGYGDSYEFARYPAKWAEIDKNIQILTSELRNKKLVYNCLVQPLTVHSVPQLLDYLNRTRVNTRLTWLVNPEWQSWSILKDEEKSQLIEYLENEVPKYRLTKQQREFFQSLGKSLNGITFNPGHRKMFVKKLGEISQSRLFETSRLFTILGTWQELFNEVTRDHQSKGII